VLCRLAWVEAEASVAGESDPAGEAFEAAAGAPEADRVDRSELTMSGGAGELRPPEPDQRLHLVRVLHGELAALCSGRSRCRTAPGAARSVS
jgi:hypothetical protein